MYYQGIITVVNCTKVYPALFFLFLLHVDGVIGHHQCGLRRKKKLLIGYSSDTRGKKQTHGNWVYQPVLYMQTSRNPMIWPG